MFHEFNHTVMPFVVVLVCAILLKIEHRMWHIQRELERKKDG